VAHGRILQTIQGKVGEIPFWISDEAGGNEKHFYEISLARDTVTPVSFLQEDYPMNLQKNWTKPSIEVTAVKLAQNGTVSGGPDGLKAHSKS
jgi:hypothetical protein